MAFTAQWGPKTTRRRGPGQGEYSREFPDCLLAVPRRAKRTDLVSNQADICRVSADVHQEGPVQVLMGSLADRSRALTGRLCLTSDQLRYAGSSGRSPRSDYGLKGRIIPADGLLLQVETTNDTAAPSQINLLAAI